jgi:D-3-phosphoglycerate dehydrogenase
VYRILIADPLDPSGLAILEESGAEVHRLTADERPRLAELAGGFDALVVRSATKVTRALLEAGRPRLRVVGRAGIGVDNVDVKAATELGVLVVNAPTANMLSATEHTFALNVALAEIQQQAQGILETYAQQLAEFQAQAVQGVQQAVAVNTQPRPKVARTKRVNGEYITTVQDGQTGEVLQEIPTQRINGELVTTVQ